MDRWFTPCYLVEMVNQAYLNQEIKSNCNFCQTRTHYEEELKGH